MKRNYPQLSDVHKSIITGSLLGDGCCTNPAKGNSRFQKGQTRKRREYLEWHSKQLNPLLCYIYDTFHQVKGKHYESSSLSVQSHPYFNGLRQKWYPNGKKVVPSDISIDPLALAVWYCDDGSNSRRVITLHTCAFASDECERLVKLLDDTFSIKSYVSNHRNRIIVRACYHEEFIAIVAPFVTCECFKYKIELCPRERKKYRSEWWNNVG